jgi:hypothetical protein
MIKSHNVVTKFLAMLEFKREICSTGISLYFLCIFLIQQHPLIYPFKLFALIKPVLLVTKQMGSNSYALPFHAPAADMLQGFVG